MPVPVVRDLHVTTTDPAASRAAAPPATAAEGTDDRAERWAERFAVPAFVAALASIPAVFLTLAEGTAATAGEVLNIASATVLVAEGVVLFLASQHKRAWVRRNWWLLATIAIVVPATIFAVGPAQLLRLVRSVGALRVLRVRRIVKAGQVATRRFELSSTWRRVVVGVVSVLSAAFVGVVLADPSSTSGGFARDVADAVGPLGVIAAGAVLAVATFLVLRDRS